MKDGSDPPSPNSTRADFRREGRPIIFDPFLESALFPRFVKRNKPPRFAYERTNERELNTKERKVRRNWRKGK